MKYRLLLSNIIFLTFLPVLFTISCTNSEETYTDIYHTMLETSSFWSYYLRKDNSEQGASLTEGRVWCGEYWEVIGSELINGKTYYQVKRSYAAIGGLTRNDIQDYWTTIIGPEVSVFHLREENGRVYGLKRQYVEFLQALLPNQQSFYLPLAEDIDEVLLYDFTLRVGDVYPMAGNDVRVSTVYWTKTQDGIKRKVLLLNNGFQIMEGIGILGSYGSLIAYQNAFYLSERRDYISYLLTVRRQGMTIYQNE